MRRSGGAFVLETISVDGWDWIGSEAASRILTAVISIGVVVTILFGLRRAALRSITDTNTRYRVRKVIAYAGYLLVALFLIATFSERLGQLTVILGVAGAGIAFALQEVIASIAGWAALSFGNFYRPGDRVQLGGIKGDVIDIGMLRTTLMEVGGWVHGDQYNGRIVRVANSFVFKEPVFNYSGDFSFLWDEIKIPIRYGSDWQLAQRLIEEAVRTNVESYTQASTEQWNKVTRKFLIEQARIEPAVTVAITDNWLEFTARYIVEYRKRRSTKDAITRTILTAIERHEEDVRFGSTTIEMVSPPVTDDESHPQ